MDADEWRILKMVSWWMGGWWVVDGSVDRVVGGQGWIDEHGRMMDQPCMGTRLITNLINCAMVG